MIDLGHKSGADVYYIVGFDQEKTLTVEGKKVFIVPVWKWILE